MTEHFLGIDNTANAAEKLSDDAEFNIWGQTFFKNGVPSSVEGYFSGSTGEFSGQLKVGSLVVGDAEITFENGYVKINKHLFTMGYAAGAVAQN